jgi:hypothetical protein
MECFSLSWLGGCTGAAGEAAAGHAAGEAARGGDGGECQAAVHGGPGELETNPSKLHTCVCSG